MYYLTLNYNRVIEFLEKFNSENLGLYFSFFLHFIILLSIIGLPSFFGPKEIFVPTIIPIEIINVTNFTSLTKKTTESKNLEIKNKQVKIKEKKFNSSNNQEIKKIDIKEKPKIKENIINEKITPKEKIIKSLAEKKDIKIELDKKNIEIDTNSFETLPTKKIKPKLKPQLKPKIIEATPKSDVVIENKPKPKPVSEFNIASMLKDLRNDKTIKKIESDNEEKQKDIIEKKEDELTSEISQLSISEIDLVLQQLSKCFIAPAGAKIKKTMFVKISAKIQPNRKVYENSIRIVDTNISKSSPIYGPITESAMRTLLNPECIPLKLPEDKYDLWKNLTMKFDYSVMRGS